jgi:peptidoglycan/xylan/chitin deacetylase (PgdA/CDA1 family)
MNFYLRLTFAALLLIGAGFGVVELAKQSDNKVAQFIYHPRLHQVQAADEQENSFSPAAPQRGLPVPILMYHHVGDLPVDADGLRQDLTVSKADFTAQVNWLVGQGYHSVTLEQVYQATQKQIVLPDKPIVFTFDDGYDDALINVPPILRAKGYSGSFGIITRYADMPGYATWDQIRAAQTQGMEIVSHTQDHFDGTSSKYNYEFIKQNLAGSQVDLARELGIGAHILIYPYGHFSADYIKAAQEDGFNMALTTAYGNHVDLENLMQVPRVRVHGNETLVRFIEILTGTKQLPQTATGPDSL